MPESRRAMRRRRTRGRTATGAGGSRDDEPRMLRRPRQCPRWRRATRTAELDETRPPPWRPRCEYGCGNQRISVSSRRTSTALLANITTTTSTARTIVWRETGPPRWPGSTYSRRSAGCSSSWTPQGVFLNRSAEHRDQRRGSIACGGLVGSRLSGRRQGCYFLVRPTRTIRHTLCRECPAPGPPKAESSRSFACTAVPTGTKRSGTFRSTC